MEDLLWCSNHSVEYLVHSLDKPHFREPCVDDAEEYVKSVPSTGVKTKDHAQLHWSLLRRPLVDFVSESLPHHPLASGPPEAAAYDLAACLTKITLV